jgi:hypothetical protein
MDSIDQATEFCIMRTETKHEPERRLTDERSRDVGSHQKIPARYAVLASPSGSKNLVLLDSIPVDGNDYVTS